MLTPRQARKLAASDLFDPPPGPSPIDHDAAVPLPPRIGAYRVIRRIGAGGMGTVYEAEQDEPRRRVAIKVLRRGVADRETVRRFRLEYQLLAKLQHPGIAQIFDAGTYDDGGGAMPYFVMEFIQGGTPITDFVRDHDLTLRARVRLFLRAAEAVHHGHLRGVVHRDLKPQNILVVDRKDQDDIAKVKIIDFGVARSLDDGSFEQTTLTHGGQVLGTLPYMSPEQCDGDADARSDVYALGVVLYELLVERPPFELASKSVATAIRIIQEEPPQIPAELGRPLRGGLANVVLKSLEKDRSRRYQSLSEFTADVKAWMDGEPVSAKPPGAWTKLGHSIRRHPLITTSLAAGLIASTIIGSSLVTWGYLENAPARIDTRRLPHSALLLSHSGAILREYGGTGVKIPVFHKFEERGRNYLLVAVPGGMNHTNGQLSLMTLNEPDSPIWTTTPTEFTPPPLPASLSDQFQPKDGLMVSDAVVADVFEDCVGREIIVSFMTANSDSVICVLSMSKELLFEAWHLGPIRGVHWLSNARLIVAIGDRHGREEIAQYGWDDPGEERWPDVVFALRPSLRKRHDWLNDYDDPVISKTIAWYKVLLPPSLIEPFSVRISHSTDPILDPGSFCQISLTTPEQGFDIVVDARGQIDHVELGDALRDPSGEGLIENPVLADWPPSPTIVESLIAR